MSFWISVIVFSGLVVRLVSARGAGRGGLFLRWRQEEKVPNECSFFPKE